MPRHLNQLKTHLRVVFAVTADVDREVEGDAGVDRKVEGGVRIDREVEDEAGVEREVEK